MTDENDFDVLVLGGGISGLTTAWQLKTGGASVGLLESAESVGGCTRTERRDGFLLEKGPFNVMVRDPSFEDLLGDFSEDLSIVPASATAKKRYIYRGGRLLAVPTNPVSLMTTPMLSAGAKCRLLSGLVASGRSGDTEATIEQAATRRFGREVADTMISAVISGVFAGDIARLSLPACFPSAGRVDAAARSLLGYGLASAFRSKRDGGARRKRRWRGLVSIDGGLGALTAAIGQRLGDDLMRGTRAEAFRATASGFEVDARCTDGSTRVFRCRRLVLASSAAEAGRLLEPVVPQAQPMTDLIESASLVVLNLGFRKGDIGHPLDGFGFLVPRNEPDFPLMGCLFADSVFPHHAPPENRLLRVFIGGARDPNAITYSDDKLVRTAESALGDLLHVTGHPVLVDVCRYDAAIPQYHVGHAEKIKQLRAAVAQQENLHLVGNYLEGVSLNDCVRLATQTAHGLLRKEHHESITAPSPDSATATHATHRRDSPNGTRDTVDARPLGSPAVRARR